jgi:hypothetical protein
MIEPGSSSYHQLKDNEVEPKRSKKAKQPKHFVLISKMHVKKGT